MDKAILRRWAPAALAGALAATGLPAAAHNGETHATAASAEAAHTSQAPHAPDRGRPARHAGTRWGRDYFPNVELTTHDGSKVRFFDDLIEDRVVLITFLYTSCEDSCPLGTAQLVKVQRILGDRVGRDIFMYSISIDPERDTPAALRRYRERFGVGPGWTFLTGSREDVTLLRRKLGMYIEGLRHDLKDHNMSVLMGNQSTGRWMARSPMENPYYTAEQVGTWLSNWRAASRLAHSDYADAPKLATPTMGENLFRTRCAVCHSMDGGGRDVAGDGTPRDAVYQRAGPDLLWVTRRRGREWLVRWIGNPARMLAEKDPVALELYERHDHVLMPNFHLGEVSIDALIEFLQARALEAEGELAARRADP